MLQSMRGRTASIITKILFGILALSFVIWGVEGAISNIRNVPPVLVVGKIELDGAQLTAKIDRNLQMLQRSLGTKLDRAQMMQLGLYDQALDRLIGELLIEQEAANLGLKVGDDSLRIIFRGTPGLLKSDGSVDVGMLRQISENSGFSNQNAFLTNLRQQVASGSLLRSISNPPPIPSILSEGISGFKFEQRAIDYAVMTDGTDSTSPMPDAAKIAAYQKEHPQFFTAPETRKLSYATLSPGQLLAQISIKDDELKTVYNQRKEQLTRPERRQIEQIPFDSEDAAKTAHAKLSGKNGFADLAKSLKLAAKDYQLGTLTAKELPKELSDAAFALSEGAISQPIKTQFGYSLLRVGKIEPAMTPSFEQIYDRLLAETKTNRATDLMYDNVNKIESLIDGGTNLAKIAGQFGLTITQLPMMDDKGQALDAASKITIDKALLKPILKAGFELKSGEASRPIELRDQNIYLIVSADTITPAALKPVSAVQGEIIARIKAENARNQGEIRAKSIVDDVKSKGNFAETVKKSGLTLVTSPFIDRSGRGGDGKNYDKMPVMLLADLFKNAPKGEAAFARSNDDTAWIIGQVAEIKHADTSISDKDRQTIAQDLARGLQTDLIEQYIMGLKQKYKVEVDRKAFAKLF
ncbi:MAG: peptidyl-prolyl cis-trans isomerase [Alphaproteobacteria bacterium]|nr:peptidyl-prolyl cis-trans isomerase [Alphaproteobacteria bacterium]